MFQREKSSYKFDKIINHYEGYPMKGTVELMEELENLKNLDEITIDMVNDKIGTFAIPIQKNSNNNNNLSKVFNLSFEPVAKGAVESLEINLYNSNRSVDTLASLNTRINVQATSKICDMTKRKSSEAEDGGKSTRQQQQQQNNSTNSKEMKTPSFSNNKNGASQNKEIRKTESNFTEQIYKKPNISNKIAQKTDFSTREKVLHLLALKPTSKDALLLGLHKLGVTSNERSEVEKTLQQISTLNKDNMYQLSNQFIFEIRDDWPHYDEISRNRINRLKADVKPKMPGQSNNVQASKTLVTRDPVPFHDDRDRKSLSSSSSSSLISSSNNNAPNIARNNNKTIIDHGKVVKTSDKVLNSRNISSELDIKKHISMSNNSRRNGLQTTISPAESNSSFKTGISNDDGFISGDKESPVKLHNVPPPNKRRFHNISNNSNNDPACKKILLSEKNARNDINSSSSCDVTPTSDTSLSSNESRTNIPQKDLQRNVQIQISTSNEELDGVQIRFNVAFEEYSQLCSKLKEREAEIEKLRAQCSRANNLDYARMYKIAKTLLEEMETPQFQEITARVKSLESELSEYVRVLSCSQ